MVRRHSAPRRPSRPFPRVVLGLAFALLMSAGPLPSRTIRAADAPVDTAALRRAVEDLVATFGERYPRGREFLDRLGTLEQRAQDTPGREPELAALRDEALFANPLLDFDRLLLIRRRNDAPSLGLPMNWQGNCSLPRTGFNDELAVLSPVRPGGAITTVHKPAQPTFVGDVDLHFDGTRLLFSTVGENQRWQVRELSLSDGAVRSLTGHHEGDVDNYDACYLPDGDVMFTSTACFKGVPCVQGSDHVANMYRMDASGHNVRQLTFDQDHNWCPTVMEDGRVLYLRWEYSDIPHFVSRILFRMNPDGTEQTAYYGSNSYWPNSMFFARPIPGHPSKFVTVISGHHDVPRMGELLLFDAARGHREADGAVQRIPGYGKPVTAVLRDDLVKASWPKFLHPWPLSDKYFLVSAKLNAESAWGLYLVDVFDNMVRIAESSSEAYLEPVPLRATARPPVLPSRVDPNRDDAAVYIEDIYQGPGLAGIPRGTVKRLRLFTYHFAYHGMGGQVNRVGLDGPWDVKGVLGTVPVEEDGSAAFRIPANTPISIQPLDGEGKSLQLMRSWLVGMPGERVSCVGCHDGHRGSPPNKATRALEKGLVDITPWYGPARGFSFNREVQPVLDRHCVGCHDGSTIEGIGTIADLRLREDVHPTAAAQSYNEGTKFSPAYLELRRFVRSPTIESDMHLLMPMEFHADTTRLVRMLDKGHYGVRLGDEDWDRIITWIDLGTPAHGTWRDIVGDDLVKHQYDRRRALAKRYAGRDEDPEAFEVSVVGGPTLATEDAAARAERIRRLMPRLTGGSAPASATAAPTAAGSDLPTRRVDLGGGVTLELTRIPAGSFTMGDGAGYVDERPARTVDIAEPYWIGRFEITNEQYRRFAPAHDSRLEHGDFLQFSEEERGYSLNGPTQPVCRVPWHQAAAFCEWLSGVTSEAFSLPTESQWEYACRAGGDAPLSYGGIDASFATRANLADARFQLVDNYVPWSLPVGAVPPWRPADARSNDTYRVSAPVGSFEPNRWGLHDMHGNVAEWTRDAWSAYPGASNDGGPTFDAARKVVRGGSWYDRPQHARSAFRAGYQAYQPVFDVGFRVVCKADP
ncbi:MAG: hypothetical protein FJ297_18870 [Planctomycetes bacterium]|nr:hypothetical protein [Planctomycetota bacterium]